MLIFIIDSHTKCARTKYISTYFCIIVHYNRGVVLYGLGELAPALDSCDRAIALDPDLIMYDEPFAGLDPISLGTAAQLIRRLNDSLGITSLIVSHDVKETFEIADHVVVLANGGVVAQGSPAELMASTDPLIHQFVHALSDGPVPFHYPAPGVSEDFGGRPA